MLDIEKLYNIHLNKNKIKEDYEDKVIDLINCMLMMDTGYPKWGELKKSNLEFSYRFSFTSPLGNKWSNDIDDIYEFVFNLLRRKK